MKLVLAQSQFNVGDFEGNQKKILSLRKKHKNCDLIIFPEMALSGYPLEDLLERPHFIQKNEAALKNLKKNLHKNLQEHLKKEAKTGPALLFGAFVKEKAHLFNAALFLSKKETKIFRKTYLALDDTFDEGRFLKGGGGPQVLKFKGKNFLILICEDLWQIKKFPYKKCDAVISLHASPFFPEQIKEREEKARKLALKLKAPVFYLNLVGGQDEWLFDGTSFILNQRGEMIFQAPSFQEKIFTFNFNELNSALKIKNKKQDPLFLKKEALVMGIRAYIQKNHFKKTHLGLSGGLDSALTAHLLKEALGSKNITGVFLKGLFSSKKSRTLSLSLAQELGLHWREFSIDESFHNFCHLMNKLNPLAKENLQARLRLLFLMSLSNNENSLLIGTGNKSELALGYSTLYGDLAGALLPIGDLYKSEVQKMAEKFYLSQSMTQILKRKPSAELKKNQSDSKDLGASYEKLDIILERMIEKKEGPKNTFEKEIFKKLFSSEFKRRSSPLVLKVSSKAFGRGRRYPISQSIWW